MIEINVQESGLVTVTLVLDGSASETDTVPCQGGMFSVTISLYQSDHIIDGEITCGAQSVSGNYSIWGG